MGWDYNRRLCEKASVGSEGFIQSLGYHRTKENGQLSRFVVHLHSTTVCRSSISKTDLAKVQKWVQWFRLSKIQN